MDYQYSKKYKIQLAKRNRQIKRRVMLFSVGLLLLISIGYLGLNSNASVSSNDFSKKYYHQITVNKNDTLWGYANKYSPDGDIQKYIDEVMRMNHMTSSKLVSGQYLIIPCYS